MRAKVIMGICGVTLALMIGSPEVWAAKKSQVKQIALSDSGQKFMTQYAEMLEAAKGDILKSLPQVSEQKKSIYLEANKSEKNAKAAQDAAIKTLAKIGQAQGSVGHAKGKWIGGAEKGIAASKAKLAKATTDAEREAAQGELVKWQKNKEDGLAALKERQVVLDEAKKQEPKWIKDLEGARAALSAAQANTLKALKGLGLDGVLKSDKLDAKLAESVVLSEATPRGLAAFAQQGKAQKKLIDQLLADDDLMIQMVAAYGAQKGKYGQAIKIYSDIHKASKNVKKNEVLQRLALAVSLEHAVPIKQRSATAVTDAPATVDPVNRYLHYEKAFLDGELDVTFKDLSVWDYRMVVNGEEPDEIIAWGRQMLRAYRPDHLSTPDYRWRYVAAVRTDIRYGSQFNKYDKPELQFFQNILMNGGVCGRRAFFGRFILRAFGIPTIARPQRGHAALIHWTPKGWVACLGGGWGVGYARSFRGSGKRVADRDFLAVSQGRESKEAYMQVLRAQWIGDVLGEPQGWGLLSGTTGFWNNVALYQQRAIIEEAKAVALAAVGEELGEANESNVKYDVEDASLSDLDKKIVVSKDGVITIPAAACSKPTKSTGKIVFMKSDSGGKQLHYSRNGGPQNFEYAFKAAAGTYALTAQVAVPSCDQHLLVAVNSVKVPVDIALPLTVGLWGTTAPVKITLAKGDNELTFSRGGENIRGLTVKKITLTPVK